MDLDVDVGVDGCRMDPFKLNRWSRWTQFALSSFQGREHRIKSRDRDTYKHLSISIVVQWCLCLVSPRTLDLDEQSNPWSW